MAGRPSIRQAVEAGTLEIVTETQLWQRLGLVSQEPELNRLYTPAMLAELLPVPLAVIRRWHRRGLVVPVCEVRRLPYFDFQEVATAQRRRNCWRRAFRRGRSRRSWPGLPGCYPAWPGRWPSCRSSSRAGRFCCGKATA